MMILHKSKVVDLRNGARRYTTLCGRMNKRCADGMNIANRPEEVTCKFCLARMNSVERVAPLDPVNNHWRHKAAAAISALTPQGNVAEVVERLREAVRISAQAFRTLEEVAVAQLEHDKARNFIKLGDICREAHSASADLLSALTVDREKLREALSDIANAVRLGSEYDVLAWANLAQACQDHARAALTYIDADQASE